jgi:hypothetical protein
LALLACIVYHPSPLQAGMGAEIDHLLWYIESSDCQFNRNGTIHESRDAVNHIRRKYTHTKRWIKSTEDFIRYAATKSSTTGRPYKVICKGVERPMAEWLTEELVRFREGVDGLD